MKRMTRVTISLLGASLISVPAMAQETPANESANGVRSGDETYSSEEILVTARRRQESLQVVPISISALSADDLVAQGVVSQIDLQRSVPGLQLRTAQDRNFFNYAIRGQTVDSYSGSFPGVLSYINDVQISAVTRSAFYDLSSIQVLKGPQGTLFGRNTTGGAVLFTTAAPTDQFEGYARASYGNYNLREVEAVINLPLSDAVQVRLATDIRRRDGYSLNLANGQRLNNDHSDSFRGSIRLSPGSGFTSTIVVDYSRIDETSGNILHNVTPCAQGGLVACIYGPANTGVGAGNFGFPSYAALVAANPSLPAGGIEQRFRERETMRYWDTYLNVTPRAQGKNFFATNTTQIELSDTLILKNVAGYSSQILRNQYDTDATDIPIFGYISPIANLGTNTPTYHSRQWSEEIQLQGETADKKFNWIIGGIYSESQFKQSDLFAIFAFPPFFDGIIQHNLSTTENRSFGVFAQATWDASSFVEGLSVTSGIRWSKDRVQMQRFASRFALPLPLQTRTQSRPSWTVSLDYKASPDVLFYVANRGSWRTGGFNINIEQIDLSPFGPETVVDIEAGMKAKQTFGNVDTLLNVAVYKQWIRGTQRLIPVLIDGRTGGITLNVPGGSRVEGLEVTSSVSPVPWATVGANYAYTRASYPQPNIDIRGVSSFIGPYSNTPEHAATFYVEFEFPVGSNEETFRLRSDYYVQSESFFSNFGATTQPGSRIEGYGLANLSASVENIGAKGVSIGFLMNNVFNKGYASGGIPTGATLGFETSVPGEPRTFRFDVRYKF